MHQSQGNTSEKSGEGSKGQRSKPPTATLPIDALIGDGEWKKRKEQLAAPQPSYPLPISRFLRPSWIIR